MSDSQGFSYDPEKSIEMLRYVEGICADEVEAAMHLAVCLVALCPDLDIALDLVRYIDSQDTNEACGRGDSIGIAIAACRAELSADGKLS